MARKKKIEIPGGWFPVSKDMMRSEAFDSLSGNAVKAYFCFLNYKKNNENSIVCLAFSKAKKKGICKSSKTFIKIKQELVEKGFIDCVIGNGIGESSRFYVSYRWKYYNTDRFEIKKHIKTINYNHFNSDEWKDKNK